MAVSTYMRKILDQFSFYSYKESYGQERVDKYQQWVPNDDVRRLEAYAMLESYYRNSARNWLNSNAQDEDVTGRREYGDPHLLVNVALSSLLGNSQRIVVDGSVGGEVPAAVAQQEALEQWALNEKLPLKMLECERTSIKLGDGVYVLGWDEEVKRPRLTVYDPGFYYPHFDAINKGSEDFPSTICIAYEYEDRDPADPKDITIFVRRIRWRLLATETEYSYKWNDAPTNYNVAFDDAIWRRNDIKDEVFDFDMSEVYRWVSYETEPDEMGQPVGGSYWLDLDYIPVVHVPNTVSVQNHFGDSMLGPVMQLLDDVVATDTDIQKAAATSGSPPIAVSGVAIGNEIISYGPGTVLSVGDGGTPTVIDTSMGLRALMELKNEMLERLSVNTRTPESLLGRVKPNEVPSGIALTLSFTPHSGMITEMRLVRYEKNTLMLKFVSRMYLQAGLLQEVLPCHVKLGSYLPADKQETMTIVMNLYSAKAISLETAVTMLIEAGYPIEDWVEEIERIESRDVGTANELVTMTGDPNVGMRYLGLPEIAVVSMEDTNDEPAA